MFTWLQKKLLKSGSWAPSFYGLLNLALFHAHRLYTNHGLSSSKYVLFDVHMEISCRYQCVPNTEGEKFSPK